MNEELITAIQHFDAKALTEALKNGANVEEKIHGYSPLLLLLSQVQNVDIDRARDCVKVLLEHNARVDNAVLAQIVRIGQDFEFYRDDMEESFRDEKEAALKELYSIFDVEPVPPRRQHDGKELITVKSKRWQTQHDELWDLLVPGKGQAKSVQGEVIRLSGRISYELLDNGGINWDDDFVAMVKALPVYFRSGIVEQNDLNEAEELCEKIIASNGDFCDEAQVGRLSELCVKWILANPEPMKLARQAKYHR